MNSTFCRVVGVAVLGYQLFCAVPAFSEEITSTGTWRGTMGADTMKGSWTAQVTQSGNRLSGTATLAGAPFREATVSGTVADDGRLAVSLSQSDGKVVVTCTSTKVSEGMNGDFDCEGFKGRWVATSIVRRGVEEAMSQ